MSSYRRPQILDRIPLDRHAVLEANAGTGKTFTLEHLVVELLLKARATLEQILAVTYTEKATGELRARIRAAIERALTGKPDSVTRPGERVELDEAALQRLRDALFAFERAPIFTIHSFCHRMLAEFAFLSGTRFALEVVDGRAAFHEAFREELRANLGIDEQSRQLLVQWLDEKEREPVTALEDLLYDAYRRRYRPTAESGARASQELASRITDVFLPPVQDRLSALKRERGVIDYDDMLTMLWDALERPEGAALVATLRARFRYALIDEFQDTDEIQWNIFRRVFLEGGSDGVLIVIGDPKQAIYSFRDADVFAYQRAKTELTRHYGADFVALDENFRSTSGMLDAVNRILDQKASTPFFTGDIKYDHPSSCAQPSLRATVGGLPLVPVTVMRLPTDLNSPSARALLGRHIASTLRTILNGQYPIAISSHDAAEQTITAKDIFVLTRTGAEGLEIARYLREAGVPYAFYKQEGLFQTDEAGDILDVLRAVADPERRSCRLKAWATPFFDVPFQALPHLQEVPASSALMALLSEWRALAIREEFAALFDALLHQSGLTARELLLAGGQRELTNYEHIFEVLLEQAVVDQLDLAEIIERLATWVAGRALPPGEDRNVQRLESERAAVQIMTVHKAKGLEADVVALFGGFYKATRRPLLFVHHPDGERRVGIGDAARTQVAKDLRREELEEDQRLLYVAMTRARAKLLLPLWPDLPNNGRTGYYSQLNQRLRSLVADCGSLPSDLFTIEDVTSNNARGDASSSRAKLDSWRPPSELLRGDHDDGCERRANALARSHWGLEIRSYTSMQRRVAVDPEDIEEEFKVDLPPAADAAEPDDLPGGRRIGIFLHELIERLDLVKLNHARNLTEWASDEEVRPLIDSSMRRHQVPDRERWRERCAQMVFDALRAPVALNGQNVELAGCESSARETEFTYPIPYASQDSLERAVGERWKIERGVLVGYIDFIFRHEGRTYFADWKSDTLESYEPRELAEHVMAHYQLQAKIYSVGVVRLLRILNEREYERRFGGLLYVFLRGVRQDGAGRAGIYFMRPSWRDVVSYERELGGGAEVSA